LAVADIQDTVGRRLHHNQAEEDTLGNQADILVDTPTDQLRTVEGSPAYILAVNSPVVNSLVDNLEVDNTEQLREAAERSWGSLPNTQEGCFVCLTSSPATAVITEMSAYFEAKAKIILFICL
jgi:hypothetical protein